MVFARRGEDILEAGARAGDPQHAELLDAAQLLGIGSPQRERCRHEVARVVESMRGQILGDPLCVPGRRVERAQRECEGMDALVQQQVPHGRVGDRLAGQVQVAVAHRLQDRQRLAAAAAEQQLVLGRQQRDGPRVACEREEI